MLPGVLTGLASLTTARLAQTRSAMGCPSSATWDQPRDRRRLDNQLTETTMADFTFLHGGASVPNLDSAIDWYGCVLGFEVDFMTVVGGVGEGVDDLHGRGRLRAMG